MHPNPRPPDPNPRPRTVDDKLAEIARAYAAVNGQMVALLRAPADPANMAAIRGLVEQRLDLTYQHSRLSSRNPEDPYMSGDEPDEGENAGGEWSRDMSDGSDTDVDTSVEPGDSGEDPETDFNEHDIR